MDVSELDYELPPELIAQHPAERRDASRLLVYDRATGAVRHRRFAELPDELVGRACRRQRHEESCRRGFRIESPRGEVLLLERLEDGTWEALARPTRRLRAGRGYGPVELLEHLGEGRWRLRLDGEPDGRDAAAAVHHRAARRSRPLPDRLRARAGLRGGADGRAPLHAGAARAARPGARHAPRRPRHVPAGHRGDARGARDPRRALRGRAGGVGADPGCRARPRRRHDDGARARDARPRRRRSRAAPSCSSRRASSSAASTRC